MIENLEDLAALLILCLVVWSILISIIQITSSKSFHMICGMLAFIPSAVMVTISFGLLI